MLISSERDAVVPSHTLRRVMPRVRHVAQARNRRPAAKVRQLTLRDNAQKKKIVLKTDGTGKKKFRFNSAFIELDVILQSYNIVIMARISIFRSS